MRNTLCVKASSVPVTELSCVSLHLRWSGLGQQPSGTANDSLTVTAPELATVADECCQGRVVAFALVDADH